MHTSASHFGTLAARPPHAEPGQRIGLLGGSFNPPHRAHRSISLIALKRLGLDRVWWLVTPGNPLKDSHELLPLGERVARSRAIAADTRIVITDFEAQLGSGYTAATLEFLRMRFPATHFVWLMGADCLYDFHRWHQWRDIFHLLPVAVVDRPGWRFRASASRAAQAFAWARRPETQARGLALADPPAWTYLSGPLLPVSSTVIRAGATPAVAEVTRSAIGARRSGAGRRPAQEP